MDFSSYSKSLSKSKIALHCRVPPPACPHCRPGMHTPILHSQVCGPENWAQGASFTRREPLVLSPEKCAGGGEYTRVLTPGSRPDYGERCGPHQACLLSGFDLNRWSCQDAWWHGGQHGMHIKGFCGLNTGHSFLLLDPFNFLPWLPFISTYMCYWTSQFPFLDLCFVICKISFIARTSLQIPSMCLVITATCFLSFYSAKFSTGPSLYSIGEPLSPPNSFVIEWGMWAASTEKGWTWRDYAQINQIHVARPTEIDEMSFQI